MPCARDMDSTQAIVRLWRFCVPSGAGPEAGGDGALPLETLKTVLERELEDKLAYLNGASVDDILWRYMAPDENGVVGFLQFWRGMEEILYTCRVHRQNLSVAQLHAINGFRYLRTCVLEMALGDASQERSVFRVSELRYFIKRTTNVAGPHGATFWNRQAEELPEDSTLVTGEEVASALLSWLEDLVWNNADQGSGVPPVTPSTALPSTTRASVDSHGDESEEEGGAAHETDTSSGSGRDGERPRGYGAAALGGSGRTAQFEIKDGAGPWGAPLQAPQQQHPLVWGHCGVEHRAMSPQKQQGVSPYGPAPRRSVIDRRGSQRPSLAESSSGTWSEREIATDRGGRGHTLFEAALVSLMDRFEKRPPVHRAQAHMWRDAVEFQCELRRRLAESPALTFSGFHLFAKEQMSLTARRRRNRSPSPRMRTAIYGRWVPTLMPVLRKIVAKRLACGFQALVQRRRSCRQGGPFPPSAGADDSGSTILQRLLKDQARTAVILERNVKISSRAGGLAFCLARLLRAALHGACSAWQHRLLEVPRLPLGSPIFPAPTVLPSASPTHLLARSASPANALAPSALPAHVMPTASPTMLPSPSPQGSPVAGSSPPMRPPPARSSTGAIAKNFVRSPSARGDSARGSPVTVRGSPTAGTSTPGRQVGRGAAAGGGTPTAGGGGRRVSADSPMASRGRTNSGTHLNPAPGAGRGRGGVGPRSPSGTLGTPSASPATRSRLVPPTSL